MTRCAKSIANLTTIQTIFGHFLAWKLQDLSVFSHLFDRSQFLHFFLTLLLHPRSNGTFLKISDLCCCPLKRPVGAHFFRRSMTSLFTPSNINNRKKILGTKYMIHSKFLSCHGRLAKDSVAQRQIFFPKVYY